jgi:hypothetical protein
MLILVLKRTSMLLWTRSDNVFSIFDIMLTPLYEQILSASLGEEVYELVIKKNSGMKGMISTACGFTFQHASSLDSWSGLVAK